MCDEKSEEISESPEDVAKTELNELNSYINDLKTRIETKSKLRGENTKNVETSEEFFFKLDSSMKKNTAFVKKLRQFTAGQLESLIKDMNGLNLTKYISEISSALVESKLKMNDVGALVTFSSKLHQIYSEFSHSFFENWQKILVIKTGEKNQNLSRMRVDLRVFAELLSCGIFSNKIGLPLLGQTLTGLINQDKDDHNNLSIILSFSKHCGEEYAGLVPKRIFDLSKKLNVQLPTSSLLSPDKQQNLKNLLKDYYQSLCKHLKREHKELQAAESTNRRIMESKGELSTERKEKLELIQLNFEKFYSSAQILSDLLNEALPDLPKDVEVSTGGIILDGGDEFSDYQLDPWGDEETKQFYVELPDLREILPNFAPKQQSPVIPDEPQMTEETLDMEIEVEPEIDELEEVQISEIDPVVSTTPEPPIEEQTPDSQKTYQTKQYFENFLQNLCNCVNKELIDSAAIDFLLNLNTKNYRKKVSKVLFGVQRTRLDLLPFYARFVATINLVSQDMAVDLSQFLKQDFKYHVKKKDQVSFHFFFLIFF